MTCEEFERVLPELEGGRTLEQDEHLQTCPACSDLVSDLNAISEQARLLRESEEPSPRVWNSIEIALRQEGLIHQPLQEPSRTAVSSSRWRLAGLLPVAAALLIAFGLMLHKPGRSPQPVAQQPSAPLPAGAGQQPNPAQAMVADEEQLLKLVETRTPALRAAYESDLRDVDGYIRDAELSARDNPNDEAAQQYLMNAYEQKAMVYEMAMNRSLQ